MHLTAGSASVSCRSPGSENTIRASLTGSLRVTTPARAEVVHPNEYNGAYFGQANSAVERIFIQPSHLPYTSGGPTFRFRTR